MAAPHEVVGKSLRESAFRDKFASHVIAIQAAASSTPPDPERLICKDDILIVFKDEPDKARERGGD